MESIVTVCEMLKRPQPADMHQTVLQCSLRMDDSTQLKDVLREDKTDTKDTPPDTQSVKLDVNLTSDAKSGSLPSVHLEIVQTPLQPRHASETPNATRSSVSSDYICADSPMLPGLSQSTSSDRDSCFSLT